MTMMIGLVHNRIWVILVFVLVQAIRIQSFSSVPPPFPQHYALGCRRCPRLLPCCSAATNENENDDDSSDDEQSPTSSGSEPWETVGMISTLVTPWFTLHGERLQDNQGQLLDYWRVEKEHSVVILTLYRNRLIFPQPQYRPGVGQVTLDFAGGRVPRDIETLRDIQTQVVPRILQRELGLDDNDNSDDTYQDIYPLCGHDGWMINSSFSNQRLYGFVAVLRDDVELEPAFVHPQSYDLVQHEDVQALLYEDLKCLQCRHVLFEYITGSL